MPGKDQKLCFINILLLIGSALMLILVLEFLLRLIFPNGYFAYQPVEGVHTSFEYTYSYSYNSWGVRDREFSKQDLNKRKILLIGDSMTFGQGVEVDNTFPKIVEKDLSKLDSRILIINGGNLGTSTIRQFETVKELMQKYTFDAVGFCFYLGNDADDNYQDAPNREKAGRIIKTIRKNDSVRRWLFSNSVLFNFIYYRLKLLAYTLNIIRSFQGKNQLLEEYNERGNKGWEMTFTIIKEIKQFFNYEDKGSSFFFVLLPMDFQVDVEKQRQYNLTVESYDFLKPNHLLSSFLESSNIPHVDVTPAFIDHYQDKPNEKLFFKIDRHLNERGHKLVADVISQFLIEEQYVTCDSLNYRE